ncbi:MAG: MgtC/SapB family protein, partial [Planctomycetota bacterium]
MFTFGLTILLAPLLALEPLPGYDGGTTPETIALFGRFGIAAAIGLLVGLEREWAKSGVGVLFAGIRTFPSIAILGCACAMVTQRYEIQWFFAAGFFTFG